MTIRKNEDYIPPINLFPDEDLEEETNLIEDNQTKYRKFTYL